MGESVTLEDAKDLFFYIVYKYCKGAYKFRAWRTVENYKHAETPELTILNRPLINKMLSAIEDIASNGFWLSMRLRDWRETVKKDFIAKYGMADDTYWNDEAEESQRKAQMTHCFKCIDKEYTRVWDTFDINDQQQFLDYMKERHNLHTVEEVNKENPSMNGKSNSNKLKDDLTGFFPMQSNNTDEEDDIILPF